jgi:hypothetical protein
MAVAVQLLLQASCACRAEVWNARGSAVIASVPASVAV